MQLLLKPVLVCSLVTLAAALRATEGSGDSGRQLSDMEDLDDVQEDGGLLLEGSGDDDDDDEWDLLSPVVAPLPVEGEGSRKKPTTTKAKKKVVPPAAALPDDNQFEYDIHLSRLDKDGQEAASPDKSAAGKKTDDLYEYYDEVYPEEYKDLIKNYDSGDKDEDYSYSDSTNFDRDSVLKIDEKKTEKEEGVNDIEIRPRPTSDTEEVILETSQIFIMVGSAFVSFAIVMLTFFMCRRSMAKKRAKKTNLAFAYVPADNTRAAKEPSIVKDYQKVPTSTRELMQQYQSTRIDMYREGEPAASAPLVQQTS